jgi:hypothetical protein
MSARDVYDFDDIEGDEDYVPSEHPEDDDDDEEMTSVEEAPDQRTARVLQSEWAKHPIEARCPY